MIFSFISNTINIVDLIRVIIRVQQINKNEEERQRGGGREREKEARSEKKRERERDFFSDLFVTIR